MNVSETTGLDPNQLPYFVTDSARNRVPVAFAPLTTADAIELSSFDWLGSVFQPTWIALCGEPDVHKLTRVGNASSILGLVHIGEVMEGIGALKNNLLETAPLHRFRSQSVSSGLRGIGRVLVARLVVESYNKGGDGAVLIVARRGAADFYLRIGFTLINLVRQTYRLRPEQAEALLEKVTF